MEKIISLLCPTRERPNRISEMLESIIQTVENPQNVEIFFYIDSDDPTKDEYSQTISHTLKKYPIKFKRCQLHIGPPISISQSWNVLAKLCTGDILMMANDDLVYATKAWDNLIIEETLKHPDEIYCMWCNDLSPLSTQCAFPIVSRKWVNILGYFTPGIFQFRCNDTWIYNLGKIINRLHYNAHIIIEHRHVVYDQSKADATYERNYGGFHSKAHQDDEYLYQEEVLEKLRQDALKLSKHISIAAEDLLSVTSRQHMEIMALNRKTYILQLQIEHLKWLTEQQAQNINSQFAEQWQNTLATRIEIKTLLKLLYHKILQKWKKQGEN